MSLDKTCILWLRAVHTLPTLIFSQFNLYLFGPEVIWTCDLYPQIKHQCHTMLNIVNGPPLAQMKFLFMQYTNKANFMRLTRPSHGLGAVTANYNFSRRKWYEENLVRGWQGIRTTWVNSIKQISVAFTGQLILKANLSMVFNHIKFKITYLVCFKPNLCTLELNFGRKNRLHHVLIKICPQHLKQVISLYIAVTLQLFYVFEIQLSYLCAILFCLNLGNNPPFPPLSRLFLP